MPDLALHITVPTGSYVAVIVIGRAADGGAANGFTTQIFRLRDDDVGKPHVVEPDVAEPDVVEPDVAAVDVAAVDVVEPESSEPFHVEREPSNVQQYIARHGLGPDTIGDCRIMVTRDEVRWYWREGKS